MNLNDSKSLGSLVKADLDEAQAERSPAPRVPRIPMEYRPQQAQAEFHEVHCWNQPEAAEPVTHFCHQDDKQATAGDGAGIVLWPLAVILAIAAASFLAWALKR